MGKVSEDKSKLLPEFQKFLLERKLASEKNIPFLAYWVSRFLAFSRRHDYSATEYLESAVLEFLDALRTDKQILDWQPRQADDAIKLYYFHYLGKTGGQADIISAINQSSLPLRMRSDNRASQNMQPSIPSDIALLRICFRAGSISEKSRAFLDINMSKRLWYIPMFCAICPMHRRARLIRFTGNNSDEKERLPC